MDQEFSQEMEQVDVCKNCGSTNIEEGHMIPLCTECRNMISKKPFPLWVKIFLLALAAAFIISILNFPKVLEAGIAYNRSAKFVKELKYVSAVKELEKTTAIYPDSTEALCELVLAYYKSGDVYNALRVFDIVAGRNMENEGLVEEVNAVITEVEDLRLPTEAFIKLEETDGDIDANEIINMILEYSKTNNLNNYEKFVLASYYYDAGNLDECKRITQEIIDVYPDFADGNLLLAAVERENSNYPLAIDYCNKVLDTNVEAYDAIAAKARIELKRLNDAEALELALEAYDINHQNSYVVATLALAYHFNNKFDKREELMKMYEDGTIKDDYSFNMLKSVIKGGEKWRD
jgi:tetratricopeptide (TPR) repeat protein